jgi:hypothetical protein
LLPQPAAEQLASAPLPLPGAATSVEAGTFAGLSGAGWGLELHAAVPKAARAISKILF